MDDYSDSDKVRFKGRRVFQKLESVKVEVKYGSARNRRKCWVQVQPVAPGCAAGDSIQSTYGEVWSTAAWQAGLGGLILFQSV